LKRSNIGFYFSGALNASLNCSQISLTISTFGFISTHLYLHDFDRLLQFPGKGLKGL